MSAKPDRSRRAGAGPGGWLVLPLEGRAGPTPKLPSDAELGPRGMAWWERAWVSPSATQWRGEDFPTIVRRAYLEDRFYGSAAAWVASEMRHLDSALGLTPESRARLRWRIDAEPAADLSTLERLKAERFEVRG